MRKAGVPVAEINRIMGQLRQAAARGATGFESIGASIMSQLADGITANATQAAMAVTEAVRQIRSAAEDAARNSPKYFSYYMGERFMSQLGEGMDKGERAIMNRPPLQLRPFGVSPGANRKPNLNINVTMDRKVFTRNLDYSAKLSGL